MPLKPKLWHGFKDDPDFKMDVSYCGLCGNTGTVDTTKSAVIPKGLKTDIWAFCSYHNGRQVHQRRHLSASRGDKP